MFTIPEPHYKSELGKESETFGSGTTTKAPMPGIVDKVWVTDGQNVKVGEPLLVIIAMKMEVSYEYMYYISKSCVLAHAGFYLFYLRKSMFPLM